MKLQLLAAAAATVFVATGASAQTTTVTTLDGSQGMGAPAFETYGSNAAVPTITSSTALSADGSLQFSGDRGRVLNGNNYTPNQNYGSANSLVSLTGDYLVNNGGTAGIQSPAFRVYVQDGPQRSELIFEAANNGGYTLGQAASVTANSLFWQQVNGAGPTFQPGTQSYVLRTVAAWGDLYSANAFISAFGVGFGGGAGESFNALADNVVLTTDTGSRGYNFAATAAVPEPATWGMMIAGFGLVGASMRRRKMSVRFA